MSFEKKYSYLAKNTLLLTLSQFGSSFLSFILVPLYTDILTTTEYGIADAVKTSVTLLIYICTLHIGSAVLRFSIDNKKTSHYVFRYAMQILLYGSIFVGIGLCIIHFTGLIKADRYVLVFVLGLFIADALESILYQYLRGIDKVKIMAIASFISTLSRLGFILLTLLVLKWGLFGYLLSMTIGPLIAAGFALVNARIQDKETLSKDEEQQLHQDMIRFSIPAAISQLGWWVNNSIDRYFVIWIKGTALNGIYAMSYKIPMIMAVICNIFGQAWGISAIKEFDPKDKDSFYGSVYNLYNAGLCIVCTMLILINIPVAKLLFHNDFFEAWRYSSLLVLGTAFSGLAGFFSGIFNAVKKNKILAYSTVIAALVNIVFNLILIPSLGAFGASIATCLSFYTCFIIRLIEAKKLVDFKVRYIRDTLVYLLILAQIIFEHLESHFYIGQIVIVIIIFILFFNQIKQYLNKLIQITKNVIKA